jgi:phosphatidate cytidylyltransferase
VAIATGLVMAVVLVGSLVWRKEAFLVVAIGSVGAGVWELCRAMQHGGIKVPRVPALLGTLCMLPAAFYGGPQALVVTFALTAVAMLMWRAADGGTGAARDVAGGLLVLAYPSFLLGFAILLMVPADGVGRVFTFLAVSAFSDIGGFAIGVLFGRHPLAPSISPKKSWEGLGGSVLGCVLAGVGSVVFVLHGTWWVGAVLGVTSAFAATTGDLMESMIKRDLGIKDMSNLLPAHGGFMDRLDSLIMTAPIVWAVLAMLLPPS